MVVSVKRCVVTAVTVIIAISTYTPGTKCLESRTVQVRHPGFTQDHFVAAVYEHVPTVPPRSWILTSRRQALYTMRANLRVYERQARIASTRGADILVFPEDGIYGAGPFTRDSIEPYLEYIPDPKQIIWNPCVEPNRFRNTEVQRTLSCMARRYNFYVVANIGDRQPCLYTLSGSGQAAQTGSRCPSDGRLQHNTNVAYSPNGTLLARYHKYNLFGERQFDTPANPEYIYFDTPFGRLGTIICFDMVFAEPTINLIEQFSIDTLVFPTAWIDGLPLWPAIQAHAGFGIAMSVNVLSANIHWPSTHMKGGSGIFPPSGNISYYRDPLSSSGQLVIARVPSNSNKNGNPLPTVNNLAEIQLGLNQRIANITGSQAHEEFHASINANDFTLVWLDRDMTQNAVCQGNVCCAVTYEYSHPTSDQQQRGQPTERYALGAFDGPRTFGNFAQIHLQVCLVTKCAGVSPESCGQFVTTAHTQFDRMAISAQFNTSNVFPGVIISRDGNIPPAPGDSWHYEKSTKSLVSETGFQFPLIAASLLGRWYEMD